MNPAPSNQPSPETESEEEEGTSPLNGQVVEWPKVVSALSCLPADDHDFCVKIACALKNYAIGKKKTDYSDEESLKTIYLWWMAGGKYPPKEAEANWNSVSAKPATGNAVTIRSLYSAAEKTGWVFDPATVDPDFDPAIAIEQAHKAREELVAIRARVADLANTIYRQSIKATKDNPYLALKRTPPVGHLGEIDASLVKSLDRAFYQMEGRLLVVPISQPDRALATVQLIDGNKTKRWLTGKGTMTTGFWTTEACPEPDQLAVPIVIGEGVATVLSVVQATGYFGVCAFSTSNLMSVARLFRSEYKEAEIIILADLVKGEKEPVPQAEEAARTIGAYLAVPDFAGIEEGQPTDFNDVHCLIGLEAVSAQIDKAMEIKDTGKPIPGVFDADSYVVKRFFDQHAICQNAPRGEVVKIGPDRHNNNPDLRYMVVENMSVLRLKSCYSETFVKVPAKGGKLQPIVDYWMTSMTGRKYKRNLTFKPVPGLVAGDTNIPDGDNLNTYFGLAFTPKPGNCDLIKKHIYENLCNEKEKFYTYLMNWFARMFQRPDLPAESAIVLTSKQGGGKTFLMKIFEDAFGPYGLTINKAKDLTGDFNARLTTTVFLNLNEATWGGDKTAEGVMKALITDGKTAQEQKNQEKFVADNFLHIIVTSNNEWSVPVNPDDRRYLLLDLKEGHENDHEYFAPLFRQRDEEGGKEAFVYELLHRDISDFNPRKIPASTGLQHTRLHAVLETAGTIYQWFHECLREEEIVITTKDGILNLAPDWRYGEVKVAKKLLIAAYEEWWKRYANSKYKPGLKQFTAFFLDSLKLAKMKPAATSMVIPDGFFAKENGLQPKQYDAIRFPDLELMRKKMDKLMGVPGGWSYEEEDQEDAEPVTVDAHSDAPVAPYLH